MSGAMQLTKPSLPNSGINTIGSLGEAAMILHRQWDETHDAHAESGHYDRNLQEVIDTVAEPLSIALDHLDALAASRLAMHLSRATGLLG